MITLPDLETTQRLAGKAAIVTGGTSGIGKQTVELLRAHGAAVVFTGRNAERGGAVQAQTGARFIAEDGRSPGFATRVRDAALAAMGRIDILVNNAGDPGAREGIEDITGETFDNAMAIHLRAPWLLMAAVIPDMRAAGGGSIINMCSIVGHRVGAYSLSYSVSKAALLHLTRYAAAELGRDHIRVNSVSPGFIDTPIHHDACETTDAQRARAISDSIARLSRARQALPKTGHPLDVATAVLFLAGDESAFITGSDLVVDGGTIWGQASVI